MKIATLLLAATVTLAAATSATAGKVRTWTDSSGKYTIDATLVAFNEKDVVIERASDKQLGTVPIDKLSEKDKEYLKTKEAIDSAHEVTGGMQRWTLKDGLEIIGRLVDYGRKEIVLRRSRGTVYVNDRAFQNLPAIYQKIIPLIVQHAGNGVTDARSLEQWLASRRGAPQTFTVDGVVLEMENGDEYGIPFFMFSDKDLDVLQPGWDKWLAAHEKANHEARQHEALRLQTEAAQYHQEREAQERRRIAEMQLGLQAVEAGVTSVWEVTLYPEPGNPGPPLWVTGFARDSRSASYQALAKHPGYTVGPVRRVSN
ncbi:SHD1 domain-containing protein [Aeoliella sp.]|uniref:SHD1 domain-containing protein n=1 Tax=Aeoliella sp. TaxID=2795800 RepID=UPI003CCBFD12